MPGNYKKTGPQKLFWKIFNKGNNQREKLVNLTPKWLGNPPAAAKKDNSIFLLANRINIFLPAGRVFDYGAGG
jgi:hypothetical protein